LYHGLPQIQQHGVNKSVIQSWGIFTSLLLYATLVFCHRVDCRRIVTVVTSYQA